MGLKLLVSLMEKEPMVGLNALLQNLTILLIVN